MMTSHHHLHQASSSSDLTSASKKATATAAAANLKSSHSTSEEGGPRKRRGLMSKINKLVLRNPSSTPTPASSSSTTAAANDFKIVHEPDVTPLYTPPRPTVQPRTSSECQMALEDMFLQTSSQERSRHEPRPSTAPESDRGRPPVRSSGQRPPIPPPKHNAFPSRSFPPRGALLSTSTASARLESIPASPLTPSTIRSAPTPTTRGGFFQPHHHGDIITPATPRTVDSNRIRRAMTGDSTFRPPRPLSERAMIERSHSPPLPSPLSRATPLTSSPVLSHERPRAQPLQQQPPQQQSSRAQAQHRLSGGWRHGPLSPLGQSPPTILSPRRSSKSPIPDFPVPEAVRRASRPIIAEDAAVVKTPSQPDVPELPSARRLWLTHQPTSFYSMQVDVGVSSSSDEGDRTPIASAPPNSRSSSHSDRELPNLPSGPPTAPWQVNRALCPKPCSPDHGLLGKCTEHCQPQRSDHDDSDSSYEDIVPVRTPSRSPRRRTKPKPLSLKTTPHHSAAFTVSPASITPKTTTRSYSRPITPKGGHAMNTPAQSSPRTPETPEKVLVGSFNDKHGQEKLELGSALYHLEQTLQRENWEPRTRGAGVDKYRDVVRVRTGSTGSTARRVVMRDSNDESADTMKMLVDEEEVPQWVQGGGGGYGDWFTYYAEKEGREAREKAERRTSAGSSIYDRIQSIYDAYGGADDEADEDEDEEGGMF